MFNKRLKTSVQGAALWKSQIQTNVKKVIHVVQHLAPGGLETLTLDLLRLAKPLDQVLIVSLEGTKDKAIKIGRNYNRIKIRSCFLDKAPGVQFGIIVKLIKAFKAIRPDVVHTYIVHFVTLEYAASFKGVPNTYPYRGTMHSI